jgi:hypothetical protein
MGSLYSFWTGIVNKLFHLPQGLPKVTTDKELNRKARKVR